MRIFYLKLLLFFGGITAGAKKYRNQLVALHPPLNRKEFCESKRRNNQSGITGVYKYAKPYKLRDGTIKKIWYWEANWPVKNGQSNHKAFRISIYGEQGAKQRAIKARKKGMSEVTGTFWASSQGDSILNESNENR